MSPAFTIAAGCIGLVFLIMAGLSLLGKENAYAALTAGIGAPLFAAAAFDLITRFA